MWRDIGDISSGKYNEIGVKDDLIIKSVKLIHRYCEEGIRIYLRSNTDIFIVEGISRDKVSLAKFVYRLPFQVIKDICYLMEIDDYLTTNYLYIYRDRIDSDLPLNRCDSKYVINLSDIDRELKITLRIIPSKIAELLRVLKDRTYTLELKIRGYQVYLRSSEGKGGFIEFSRYIRPLKYVEADFKYPLKWVLKAFTTFPSNSYVDIHLAEARPMKIMFIDSPKKKLYVYIAPLVED